jgi:hypothetical protein
MMRTLISNAAADSCWADCPEGSRQGRPNETAHRLGFGTHASALPMAPFWGNPRLLSRRPSASQYVEADEASAEQR